MIKIRYCPAVEVSYKFYFHHKLMCLAYLVNWANMVILHLMYQKSNTMLQNKIIELWHISRTALAGKSYVPSRYDRMIYVKNELTNNNTELLNGLTGKRLWFFIEECIN